MAAYPHCRLGVTAAFSQIKSPYPHSAIHPNQITQSLIAVLAGLRVPFLCTETHAMGEEILASSCIKFTCIAGWKRMHSVLL